MEEENGTSVVDVIKKKVIECLESRKNANNLIDLMSYSEMEDKDVVLGCIRGFHKIFTRYLTSGELCLDIPDNISEKDLTKEEKYKMWLRERYKEAVNKLIALTTHDNSSVKELSLCTLMKFLSEEGQLPPRKHSSRKTQFPVALFRRVVKTLLSEAVDMTSLIGRFQEYVLYDDIRFHLMKTVHKSVATRQKEGHNETYLNNVYAVLEQITFSTTDNGNLSHFIARYPDGENIEKVQSEEEQKKIFSNLWIDFLQLKLPNAIYKKVLISLHEKVIPFLSNPLFLSDFLTASYNVGGAISLLALNSLFILVHKHNLDYPDFYEKLYALFEPTVLHVKYRARFFFLADLFMTSTHLPAYMVAAFAKRLARISLTAPTSSLMITIPFIYNLINRHPNCKVLLHRETPTEVQDDPYIADEPDLTKTRALESSLWELKSLQHHYHPDVSKKAQKMDQPLMREEIPLQDLLETSYSDLFIKETKKKVKHAPVNFNPPKGIMGLGNDKLNLCWTLE